jgi:hypothetical protein
MSEGLRQIIKNKTQNFIFVGGAFIGEAGSLEIAFNENFPFTMLSPESIRAIVQQFTEALEARTNPASIEGDPGKAMAAGA